MKVKIVVDAMGGDFAPGVCVKGAELALKEISDIEIYLVGRSPEISSLVKGDRSNIHIVDAKDVIGMDESPAVSVRRKRDSSINKGIAMLKDKQADVFISAGNTGAVVCAATMFLRTLPEVDRPGIAIIFPTVKGFSLTSLPIRCYGCCLCRTNIEQERSKHWVAKYRRRRVKRN
jgi:glycerol-3-phosphate acyltransferase PlsX